MRLWIKDDYQLITAQEGGGDNLSEEDIKEGLVDYFMTSVYEQRGDELSLRDAGQLLTSKPIAEMTEEEKIQRVLEYWEVHDDYVILDH